MLKRRLTIEETGVRTGYKVQVQAYVACLLGLGRHPCDAKTKEMMESCFGRGKPAGVPWHGCGCTARTLRHCVSNGGKGLDGLQARIDRRHAERAAAAHREHGSPHRMGHMQIQARISSRRMRAYGTRPGHAGTIELLVILCTVRSSVSRSSTQPPLQS